MGLHWLRNREPIAPTDANTDDYELTHERQRIISANFERYRLIAERLLTPWDGERVDSAQRIRDAVRRKPGERYTPENLALFAADWHETEGYPGGQVYELQARYRFKNRTAVYKMRRAAEAAGLLEPQPRRNITRNT